MEAGSRNNLIRQLRLLALADKSVSDGELVNRFVDLQDETAFNVLFRRHGPMVLGVCRRVLGNRHDADDAFQAVFLVLLRKAASLRQPNRVGPWLHGVACRTALAAKSLRAKRRARECPADLVSEPIAAEQKTWTDWRPLLDKELDRLPGKYRDAVVLCDLQGISRRDAAKKLRIPEGTLSSRLATARKLLAKRLARHGWLLSAGALAALRGEAVLACTPRLALTAGKAVAAMTAGQAALASGVGSKALLLAERVVHTMLLSKLKAMLVVPLMVGLVVCGGGFVAHRAAMRQQAKVECESSAPIVKLEPEANAKPSTSPKAKEEPKPPEELEGEVRWAPLGRPMYLLIVNAFAQKELSVSAEQKAALAALSMESRKALQHQLQWDWPELKRKRAAVNTEVEKTLAKILDNSQLKRLREIHRQQQAPWVFLGNRETTAKLRISKEQSLKFRKEYEAYTIDVLCHQFHYVNDVYRKPIFRDAMAKERNALIDKMVKIYVDAYGEAESILTPEQKKQVHELVGKKFDLKAYLEAVEY